MKLNRIAALAACFTLLLAIPALAAAGDGSDPLISRSYAEGTFRDEVAAALDAVCARAVRAARDAAGDGDGLVTLTLAAGDSLTLRDGQQLVLTDGGVRLSIESGTLVNCTQGWESTGGDARTYHRYVVWGGASVRADCAEAAVVRCSAGAEVTRSAPECPFTDVPEGAWYYSDVVAAVRRGLVNGMTATTYAPQGNLTLAQAVKLAACMRQLDRDGTVTLQNAADGRPWYASYADYALETGILDELPDDGWNDNITRAAFVRIFYRALPADACAPVNDIPAGSIPDVAGDEAYAREVYAFYAAGILTGYAEGNGRQAHEFGAETAISRAEVATILNRMADETARVRFEIQ